MQLRLGVSLQRMALIFGVTIYCATGVRAQDIENNEPDASVSSGERFVTRFEAELEMQRMLEAERYADAAVIGAQLAPLTEAEFGPDSPEAADSYLALADAQSKVAEYQAAEANYLHALDIYRTAEGSFSRSLIQPLLRLGDNYHRSAQFSNAISAFNEARTISRRADGLLNEGQIEMLDRITESFESLGQLAEAHQQQSDALKLIERNHAPTSQETIDAIFKYSLWLRSVHRYSEEREQYFRVERLIRDTYGDESVHLVRPLRERAISFRVQGNAAPQGSSGLRDAQEILELQPEPDPLMLAELLRDLGDWQVAFGRVATDGSEYQRSWQLLGNVPNGDQLRNEWYRGIEWVFTAPMSRRGLSDDPDDPRGHVLVRFDIDEFGRSENVVVVASEPAGLKDEAVARRIRQSRFRPNVVNGQVVTATNKGLDIIFRYVSGDEDERKD
jgi:protein TonB